MAPKLPFTAFQFVFTASGPPADPYLCNTVKILEGFSTPELYAPATIIGTLAVVHTTAIITQKAKKKRLIFIKNLLVNPILIMFVILKNLTPLSGQKLILTISLI
jgi:hypothetical protein